LKPALVPSDAVPTTARLRATHHTVGASPTSKTITATRGARLAPTVWWVARNRAVVGTASLGTNAGFNLALGANDRATAFSGNWIEPDPIPQRIRNDELARDRVWTDAAKRWIEAHPARWAGLAAARALATLDSVGHSRTRDLHDSTLAKVAGWAMLPWVLLAVVGLVLERRSAAGQLTATALLLVAASAALTIVKPRFRFPVDPLLAAFAAVAVARIADAVRRSRRPRP